jgi:hypothetical protein
MKGIIMKRTFRKGLVAAGVSVALVGLVASDASATQLSVSDGQCYAEFNGGTAFDVLDNDNFDSDYCYVLYDWDTGGGGRINHQQDVSGWYSYLVSAPSTASSVTWRVCKERQNDPDICSGTSSDWI